MNIIALMYLLTSLIFLAMVIKWYSRYKRAVRVKSIYYLSSNEFSINYNRSMIVFNCAWLYLCCILSILASLGIMPT